MIASARTRYYAFVATLVRPLAALGIRPNHLTVLGLVLTSGVAVIIGLGYTFIGGILVLFVTALDTLDGSLARATGQVTRFGAFFDATLDRYADLVLLAALFPLIDASDPWQTGPLFAAIAGSFVIPYSKARAEAVGFTASVGILPRDLRVIVYAIGVITGFIVPLIWILAVLTNVTALQRVAFVAKQSSDSKSRGEGG